MKKLFSLFALLAVLAGALPGAAFAATETACPVCGYSVGRESVVSGAERHWYNCPFCACEFGYESHTGGEATCVSGAECDICGAFYGSPDPDNHAHTRVYGYKPATCREDGASGVTVCEDCDQIVSMSRPLEKLGHTPGEKALCNEASHWYVCSVCGDEFGFAAHSGGKATCVSGAECDVCGASYGSPDPDNHASLRVYGYKPATCLEDGFTGFTGCDACAQVVDYGETIGKTGHTPGEKVLCDETSHWHVCSVCGDEFGFAAHSGGKADCVRRAVCEVCGAGYGDPDGENHAGPFTLRGKVSPAPGKEGYSGDSYCSACGVLAEKGEVIPAGPVNDKVEYFLDAGVSVVDNNAFSGGTLVSVTELKSGLSYEIAKVAMQTLDKARFIIYSFTAVENGRTVEPSIPLGLVFDIPEGYSADVLVYYMFKNGHTEPLSARIDPFSNKVAFSAGKTGMLVIADASVRGASGFVPGDINGNGSIDPFDYSMAKRSFLGTYELSRDELIRGDLNGNGRVDSSEYAMIKRHCLGTFVIPGAEGK